MYIEYRSIYNRSYNFHWNGGFANDHIANEARLYTPTTNWNVEMNHMSRKKGWEKLNRIYCHIPSNRRTFSRWSLIRRRSTFGSLPLFVHTLTHTSTQWTGLRSMHCAHCAATRKKHKKRRNKNVECLRESIYSDVFEDFIYIYLHVTYIHGHSTTNTHKRRVYWRFWLLSWKRCIYI